MQTTVCVMLSSAESASFKGPAQESHTTGTLQQKKFDQVLEEPVLLENTVSA